ncbi:MAG: DUF4912 domain-containing protein [Terriglobia bacterium]
MNPFCCAKGQLLLSVSPPFWDIEDDEDPVILELVSEERQKLPRETFLDFGPVLPHRYDVDQMELMVQNPLRVFAYWELREATILTALGGIPVQDRQNFQLLLKWKEEDTARERCLDPGTTDNWWFDTLPENHYRLELGLYWVEVGCWLPLLCSGELVTPRLALGPASEEEPPHTQALLEDLVQQTGIGWQQDRTPSPPATDAAGPLPEGNTSVVDQTPSEQHPEELISGISQPGPSWVRPTSGW